MSRLVEGCVVEVGAWSPVRIEINQQSAIEIYRQGVQDWWCSTCMGQVSRPCAGPVGGGGCRR